MGKFIVPQKSWLFLGEQSCPRGERTSVTLGSNLNLFFEEQSCPQKEIIMSLSKTWLLVEAT
jgi:hypothetical protein